MVFVHLHDIFVMLSRAPGLAEFSQIKMIRRECSDAQGVQELQAGCRITQRSWSDDEQICDEAVDVRNVWRGDGRGPSAHALPCRGASAALDNRAGIGFVC